MPGVLVTGGSRGIGAGIVLELASDGWDVALGYGSAKESAEAVATEARQSGVRVEAIGADLRNQDAPLALMNAAVLAVGEIDALVVNAGIWLNSPLVDTTYATWEHAHAVNLRSSYFLVQAFARHVIARDAPGRVIVITSRAARRPRAGSSTYAITKAAQAALVRSAAVELAPHQITVNEVQPGPTETDMNSALRDDPDAYAALRSAIPLGRLGVPSDIAPMVRFLLSPDAAFVTGAAVSVDGGASIG